MKFILSTAFLKEQPDEVLRNCAELGFREVDLLCISNWGITSPDALRDDFDGEVKRVGDLLEKYGLTAVRANTAFSPQLHERTDEAQNEARLGSIRAFCRFMKGIPIAAHYPGHIGDWKNDPEGVWRDSVASLAEIQDISREEGVILAPEIHFNTPFEKPEDARRLLREMPGLPYVYEPSHFIVKGIDCTATGDLLDGAIHCHFRTSGPGKIQAAPPAGYDSLDWMMARLRQRDYDGCLSIEYLPNADFPVPEAVRALLDRYSN